METMAAWVVIVTLAVAAFVVAPLVRPRNGATITGVAVRTGAGATTVAVVLAGCGPASQPAEPSRSDTVGTRAPRSDVPTTSTPEPAPESASDGVRGPSRDPARYEVVDVLDGDTIRVAYRGGEARVRVIGIDTPETRAPTECYGAEATDRARTVLTGLAVSLTFDGSQARTDTYGRLLAYVGLPDGRDFGLDMIRNGYAVEYTYDTPYVRRAQYRAAQDSAESREAGLWPACGGADTLVEPTTTSAPAPLPEPVPEPEAPGPAVLEPEGPEPAPERGGGELPPPPPDLDCSDISGPVSVGPDDPHRLDADGDGTGCDS